MLGTTPWPKYHYNNKNTGLSPYKSNTDGTLKWYQETDGGVGSSSPAIDTDSTIYVARWASEWFGSIWTTVGYLYAYNPDGTLKWKYDIGYSDSSPAIGADGTIYIGAWNCYLYAINPDGTLKWKYLTLGHIGLSSPAIASDGTVYIATTQNCASPYSIGDGKLYAVNPDGTLKWMFQTDDPTLDPPIYPITPRIRTSPAIGADGTIYIAAQDVKFYAINPDGSLKWKYIMGYQAAWSSPSIAPDGTIYIGANDHKMHAINPDGSSKWIYDAGVSIVTCAAIGTDGTIYFGNNRFIALNPDGTLKWEFATPYYVFSSPAIDSDGTIFFASVIDHVNSSSVIVYAVNPDGTLKWSFSSPVPPDGDWESMDCSPSIAADGTVYIGQYTYREDPESYYGALYAFQSIIPSIVVCTIKRDEGIYSKPRYCYIGEGIIAKKI